MAHSLPNPSAGLAAQLLDETLSEQQNAMRRTEERSYRPAALPRHVGVRADLGTRAGFCETHGAFTEAGHKLGNGAHEIWSGCAACAVDRRQAEALERQEAEQARSMERRLQLIEKAAIPPRFRSRTFATFNATTKAKQHALTVARDFAEDFGSLAPRGHGLIFSGLPGTGKSHLAASIMLHLIGGDRRWGVQYITCMALIRAVRETWRKDSDSTERKVLAKFGRDIDLLVIDEVGVQYGTDGEQTILFEILDRRYSEMRPTVLLTNQDKTGFKSFVGDRVMDRLAETCRWVSFDWESYRPTARKESSQ